MRYAIVSDLHANIIAWKDVLADLSAAKVDKIISLGDIVGYGPTPAETLESAYRHIDYFVMGNHDAVVAGKMSADCFNDHARAMIYWTYRHISEKGRAFLASTPLVLRGKNFVCVHGDLSCPEAFNYILEPIEALDTWSVSTEKIVFVGHTHEPAVFVLSEAARPYKLAPADFSPESDKRYIVNVGSVGDPRDGDPRSSYVIYDDEKCEVYFRRVAFDYEAFEQTVKKSGLPLSAVPLLSRNATSQRQSIRAGLDFAPPADSSKMAQNIAKTSSIEELQSSNERLHRILKYTIIGFMALLGFLIPIISELTQSKSVPAMQLSGVPTSRAELIGNILPEFFYQNADNRELQSWRYTLESRNHQNISIVSNETEPYLEIRHLSRRKIILEASPFLINGLVNNGRVRTLIYLQNSDDFSGSAQIKVIVDRNRKREKTILAESLPRATDNEWKSFQRTSQKKKSEEMRITEENLSLTYLIEAEFIGTLRIKSPELVVFEDK